MTRRSATPRVDDEVQGVNTVRRLFCLLEAATTSRAIAWEHDDAHADAYCTCVAGMWVSIRSRDGDGRFPFIFQIAVADRALPAIESNTSLGEALMDEFQRLYREAQAVVLAGDPAIIELLASLESLAPSRLPRGVPGGSGPGTPDREPD
jgi:hypothetical protein